VLAAVGFFVWAGQVTGLRAGSQMSWIIVAGAGMGLMLGQANTDAVNRASRVSYGEATGITQTVRNYGASLGFAILGTVLISEFRSNITASLIGKGMPGPAAATEAAATAQLQGGSGNAAIPQFIRADFAAATQDVLYGMGVVMAIAAVVAILGLKRGVQQAPATDTATESTSAAGVPGAPDLAVARDVGVVRTSPGAGTVKGYLASREARHEGWHPSGLSPRRLPGPLGEFHDSHEVHADEQPHD